MELRQLRYFKAIADARSFARGAHHLRVAQPALSRSIASLEDEIGQPVFVRHSAGVSLTDAGVKLYAHAVAVLGRMQELTDDMSADLGDPHGAAVMGAPPSMQSVLTTPVATAFMRRFPRVTLNIMQSTSVALRDAVLAGDIDLAVISTLTPSRGLHYAPLFSEGVCVVEKADAPARFGARINVDELADEPLLICGYPNTMRLFLEDASVRLGVRLQVRSEVNSAPLLLELVLADNGVGIVPSGAVAGRSPQDLRITPINGLEVSWTIATSPERMGSASIKHLRGMIADHVYSLIADNKWPTARLDERWAQHVEAQDDAAVPG